MPRLIRRAPLSQRIWSFFEDLDTGISEFFSSADWEDTQTEWATPAGLVVNFVFLLARANSTSSSQGSSDVFVEGGSSWSTWLCSFIVTLSSLLCMINTIYAFARTKHYRLFEASIDVAPGTPSARRVRVDSSPASGSPLNLLKSFIVPETAESRAHSDAQRHVWELAIWDPIPISLRLFSLFSPGHVVVYYLFLPLSPMDPRPSVTVVTVILLNILISAMLSTLQGFFTQQMKDRAIISQQALHEYDTKFVHPNLYPIVRDVATQTLPHQGSREVETYTPTTVINRGFHTNPNPAYAAHYDPDNLTDTQLQQSTTVGLNAKKLPGYIAKAGYAARAKAHASTITPSGAYTDGQDSSAENYEYSSPIKAPVRLARPQTGQRQASPTRGDGGSLGVYTHAASPLRKAANANSMRKANGDAELRRREGSPLKKTTAPGDFGSESTRLGIRPNGRWDDGGQNETSRYF